MRTPIYYIACLALLFLYAPFVPGGLRAQTPAQVRDLTLRVQRQWQVPAVAVAVVKDGKVLYAQQHGKLSLASDAPAVDSATLFVNASTTKAFTAALVGILVDQGYFSWTDTVAHLLPDFRLYDEALTRGFQVQDIMTHRVGFEAYALDEFPALGYTRDELYQMLPLVQPTYGLRSRYAYSNVMFIVAAKLIEKYTGLSWDQAMAKYLFEPLGMRHTRTGARAYRSEANQATGYRFIKGKAPEIKRYPRRDREESFDWMQAVAPACFVMSTAPDMARWLQLLLGGGVYAGKRILKQETLDFLFSPQTICSVTPDKVLLYAQGWRVEQGAQGRLIHHTGLASGFTSLVCLAPDLNLGVAVLMNQGSTTTAHYAVVRSLIDLCRGVDDQDHLAAQWRQFWLPSSGSGKRYPKEDAAPARPTAAYVGSYGKEVLGTARVYEKNGKPWFALRLCNAPLQHVNGDVFTVQARSETLRLRFAVDSTGKAQSFTFESTAPIGPFVREE